MSKKHSSGKLKSLLAIAIVIAMLFGTVASLASVAFAAEVTTVEVASSPVPIADSSRGIIVLRNKDEEVKDPDMVVEGSVGYDGKYCIEALNPVRIKVTNNSEEDFKGKVGIRVYLSQNTVKNSGEYVTYTKSAEIKAKEAADVEFKVYIPVARAYFLVSLENEAGEIVKSRNIYSEPVSIYNGLNAVISGNEQRDEHLRELEYTTENYYYTVNNTVFMDGEVFPDEDMINAFSSIIMRDLSYIYLGEEEKERIDEWVKNGGYLITDSYGKVESIHEETNGFNVIKRGDGYVYINKGAFKTIEDEIIAYQSIPVKRLNVHNYDPVSYSNSSTPSLETDTIGLMFIILAIYLILIGPVLYIVLRKIDKREKAIVIIPVLSVIGVVVINMASGGSVYRNGMVNVTTRFELDEDGMAEGDTFVSFRTAEMGEIVFSSADADIKPFRVDLNGMTFDDNGYVSAGQVNTDEEGTYAVFNTDKSWATSILRSDTDIKLEGGIDAKLYMEGKALKGTVTNNTGLDLDEAVLTVFNTGERIEDLGSGETEYIEIVLEEKGKPNEYYYDGNGIEAIFGMESSRRDIIEHYGNDYDNEEAFRLLKRMRHTSTEINNFKSDNGVEGIEGRIIAFCDDKLIGGGFKANGKDTVDYYENAFISEVDIDFDEESYIIPYGNIYPSDISSETEHYGNSYGTTYIYSVNEDVIYTYVLPDRESVKEFSIDRSSTYAAKNAVGAELISILNVTTGEWELLKYGTYLNASDYIDSLDQLKIKVFLTEEGEFSDPRIEVKGGSK